MSAQLMAMQQEAIEMARVHLAGQHPQLDVSSLRIGTGSGARTHTFLVSLWRGEVEDLSMAVIASPSGRKVLSESTSTRRTRS